LPKLSRATREASSVDLNDREPSIRLVSDTTPVRDSVGSRAPHLERLLNLSQETYFDLVEAIADWRMEHCHCNLLYTIPQIILTFS
jgi:hypothetical protein